MKEFNLLQGYPNLKKRFVNKNSRTIENRIVASYREKEFYDGKRANGYGGYTYDGRWKIVAKNIFKKYKLKDDAKILQIGCDKGFLLLDIKKLKPDAKVYGIEISKYAKKKSNIKIKRNIIEAPFTNLPFKKNYFDFVIAIGPVYSLNLRDSIKCLKEIERVGKGKSFITLGSYENEKEEKLFKFWTLLGCTVLSKKEWKKVLSHCKYRGDYAFNTSKTLNLSTRK